MAVTRATFAKSVTYTVTESTGRGTDRGFERQDPRAVDARFASRARPRRYSATARHGAEPREALECARCEVEMRTLPSAARDLHYLVCPRCNARFASSYTEVVAARAGVKPKVEDSRAEEVDRRRLLKARAEEFHRRADETDPYRALGLDPRAPFAEVRARYHDLAARHHPDHGGDPARMRRIIAAYERIRALAARASSALD